MKSGIENEVWELLLQEPVQHNVSSFHVLLTYIDWLYITDFIPLSLFEEEENNSRLVCTYITYSEILLLLAFKTLNADETYRRVPELPIISLPQLKVLSPYW